MRIAVCLPSFNEAKTISSITQIVDSGLSVVLLKYPDTEAKILNFDSNSTDGTVTSFLKTKTTIPKQSFIINGAGKGKNILEFCRYAVEQKIDYCLTIDSDITSATPEWVTALLEPLLSQKKDYVTPVYDRSRFEGSSTNHFAFPFVYALTGHAIRQPIAGDFAFTGKVAKLFLENQLSSVDFIYQYGIDIFMTITAVCSGCRIDQVSLGKKIHAPSFNKLEHMFPQIAAAALLSSRHQNFVVTLSLPVEIHSDLLADLRFAHKEKALEMKASALDSLAVANSSSWCPDYIKDEYTEVASMVPISEPQMSKLWIQILTLWMRYNLNKNINTEMAQQAGNELLPFFVLRAVNFWLWAETANVSIAEEAIRRQAQQLRDNFIN